MSRQNNAPKAVTPKAVTPKGGSMNPREEKVARAMELLEEGVSSILDSDSFKNYLRFMAAFHRYSPNNSLLIFFQRPDASRVAGYKRWQELGRQVRRNEEGIQIFAPMFRKQKPEDGEGTDNERGGSDERGRDDNTETARILSGFKVVKVFALEQTDHIPGAPPLPSAPVPGSVDNENGAGEAAAVSRLRLGLVQLLGTEGVRVKAVDLGEGHYGYYDRARKEIGLRRGLLPVERVSTVCHETVHHLLHQRPRGATDGDGALNRRVREIEAEGAAFAVFSYFGLDTGNFSFPYIANFAGVGSTEVLRDALTNVRAVTSRIIQAVEEAPDNVHFDAA